MPTTLETLTQRNVATYQNLHADQKHITKDLAIIGYRTAQRVALEASHSAPMTGDWVRYANGVEERIGTIHKGQLQTSGTAAFYLNSDGSLDLTTGGFSYLIEADSLALTKEHKDGGAWMFSLDNVGPGRGVYFRVPSRVWEYPKDCKPKHGST